MKNSLTYSHPSKPQKLAQKLGFLNDRNLFWSYYEPRNFGDWIGPYLFEAFSGKIPVHYAPWRGGLSQGFMAAGSVLRHIRRDNTITVWGSGIISEEDDFACPRTVLAVRGPRSRDRLHALGYPTTDVFGDPGILMPRVYAPEIAKRHRVGLIPHYFDYEEISGVFHGRDDIHVIDVCQDVEVTIDDILSCEVVLSSSLHGVIISQSYGLPCAWIKSWKELIGDGAKFWDYFEAGGVENTAPVKLRSDAQVPELEALARSASRPDLAPLLEPLLTACPWRA